MQDGGITTINIEEIEEFLRLNSLSLENISTLIQEQNQELERLSREGKFSSQEFIDSSKKLSKLNENLELVRKINSARDKISQANELLEDSDYKDIASIELEENTTLLLDLFTKLQSLNQKPLKDDEKKAIIEFRPGVGGVEASLFTEELFRMYTRYCNTIGFPIENISIDYDPAGGLKEAVIIINSEGAFGKLRFESGVHRVQRVPKTESLGRIHTSTASLVILPQIEQSNLSVKPEELRIDVYRSSGPGGQSVNTTDSAVRVTHLPTGITVSSQAGKSQHKNKEMALSILMSKLSEIEEEKKSSEINQIREVSIGGGDRSAKIRTFNFAQSRVTDHRIGKSWFNLEEILDGNLEEIVTTVSSELRKKITIA